MPVRAYRRVRVGKNSGVVVTAGRRQGAGCLSILYWITIGWWLVPALWAVKNLWILAVRLNNYLASEVVKISGQAGKPLSLGIGKLIGLILIAFPFCLCFAGYGVYSMTPAGQAAATVRAQTLTAQPTETDWRLPSSTDRPTQTDRPTPTITQTNRPTNTPIPKPTSTPTLEPTPCDCGRSYKCSDFGGHYSAQICFEQCGGVTGPLSGLDSDGDGSACEQ